MEIQKQICNSQIKTYTLAENQLRFAIIRGQINGVIAALKKGVLIDQPLRGEWTALMHASSMGHPNIVEYLLKAGSDPNCHKDLFTPLMASCASNQTNEENLISCIEFLIEYKADINAMEKHRITALMFAAKEGHAKIVAKLVKTPKIDLNLQDRQGWTALFWAVNQRKLNVVKILINSKIDVTIKDRRGRTAWDLACIKGLNEISDFLYNYEKLIINSNNDYKNYGKFIILPKKLQAGRLQEGVLALYDCSRHLSDIYASVSLIRYNLQNYNLPIDKEASKAKEFKNSTLKALQQAEIVYNELKFLFEYAKKLDETDRIIPADLKIEKKGTNTFRKITKIIIISTFFTLILWRTYPLN